MDEQPIDAFLEMLPDATIVVNGTAQLLGGNDAARQLLGVSQLRVETDPLAATQWISPTYVSIIRSYLTAASRPEGTLEFEVLGAGSVLWVEAACKALETEGEPLFLLSVRNRTARHSAEREHDLKFGRLRSAVLARSIGIYDHDHQTEEIYGSAKLRELYGLTPGQTLSLESFAEAVHPDDAEFLLEEVSKAHDPAGDGVYKVRHRIRTPSGEIRWLDSRSRTHFRVGSDGVRRKTRTIGSSMEITSSTATELAIERLASIMDATPDIVATADLAGCLTYLNRSGRHLLELNESARVKNVRVQDLLSQDCRARFEAQIVPSVAREGVWRGELEMAPCAGATFFASVVVLAHTQLRSEDRYLSIIAHDLSRQKQLEAQLLHAQKLEAVGQLAGGIAHDFNNLLSVIMGFATLVSADPAVPLHSRNKMHEILRASGRAGELTAQLLSFSRKQVLRVRVLSIRDALLAIEPMVRRLVGETIQVRLLLPPSKLRIKADPSQIEQVLVNLVVNARDAMPRGGTLTIQAGEMEVQSTDEDSEVAPGPYARLSVTDTGDGMSPDTLSRVFEPFFTTKAPGLGTGLGLSTVFGIVKQSGGTIEVRSKEGEGTHLVMCFPTTADAPEAHTDSPRGRLARVAGVILVVEDEPQLLEVIVTVLRDAGYTPLAANSPTEALKLVESHLEPISLLLTDVVMPQMSGKQLADTLAEKGSTIPVLYMSGYAGNTIANHGVLDAGISLLAKPFTPTQLLARVSEVRQGS